MSDGINPDDWDFELGLAEEIDHSPFYEALDDMDNELIVLTERHQAAQEALVNQFYADMALIMQKYKNAIDDDMKRHTPWLLNKFQQKEEES